MEYYIYKLICPITNDIKYIGATMNLKNRLAAHCNECNSTKKSLWTSLLRKINYLPLIEVVETLQVNSDWDNIVAEREQYWIDWHRINGHELFNNWHTTSIKRTPPKNSKPHKFQYNIDNRFFNYFGKREIDKRLEMYLYEMEQEYLLRMAKGEFIKSKELELEK